MPEKGRFLEQYNSKKLGWLHDSLFFIVLIAAAFVLFRFVIGVSVIGGDSMDPTLKDGEIVVYLRIVPEYRQGDVISMRVTSGDYYVKRVAAVGGDTVDIYDGDVYVNGIEWQDGHENGDTMEESGSVIYPYAVRKGNVKIEIIEDTGVALAAARSGYWALLTFSRPPRL